MRNLHRILAVLLVLSFGANIFLCKELITKRQEALPAKTVSMSWNFDWKQLPDQAMQAALLGTPWYINQQIGLWLFGIDAEAYQQTAETDDTYADIITHYSEIITGERRSKPGIYQSKNDPNTVFLCTYSKSTGTYSGYTFHYSEEERAYQMQHESVKDGIIIALE